MVATKYWLGIGALVLLSAPLQAGTIVVGVDDARYLDYDYQDVVFSLAGNSLQLNTASSWLTKPVLNVGTIVGGLQSTPYWNQVSSDAPQSNIGYCVWGGGQCNGGAGLMTGASYLVADASSTTGSANDVTFSASDAVTLNVYLRMAAAVTEIGWYEVNQPSAVHWLTEGAATFNPNGNFGIVAYNVANLNTFYSQAGLGTTDSVSHFAYFEDVPGFGPVAQIATPEPASILLILAVSLTLCWRVGRKRDHEIPRD